MSLNVTTKNLQSSNRLRERINALEVKRNDLLYQDNKKPWFDLTRYKPHAPQEIIHRSMSRFILAVCGRRFGKTVLAAKEAEIVLQQRNTRTWVVAPTYTLSEKVFREIYRNIITNRAIHPKYIKKKSEYQQIIKTTWGSEVLGKTADNKDSLEGEGLDYLIIDEAAKIKRRTWEESLRPTLTDKEGRVLFITKPQGRNWIHKLFLRGKDPDFPDWESFHFKSSANPHLKPEEIESARRELTDEAFRQEYLAEFVTFTGMVYKDFDIGVHVTAEMPDKFDKWLLGIDFGYHNPTAILVVGKRDGRYYIIDELYKRQLNEADTVNEAKRLQKKYPQIKVGYGDPSDPSKRSALNRAGFSIYPAKNNVSDGIQKVAELLKLQADGKPSIFIHPRCANLISEKEGYHYAEQKNDRNVKEEPVKENDHACDAERYVIYTDETRYRPASGKGDKIFG